MHGELGFPYPAENEINVFFTVKPLFNKGPREGQNVFTIMRFCYIEVL